MADLLGQLKPLATKGIIKNKADVEVLAPEKLRERIRAEIATMANGYKP